MKKLSDTLFISRCDDSNFLQEHHPHKLIIFKSSRKEIPYLLKAWEKQFNILAYKSKAYKVPILQIDGRIKEGNNVTMCFSSHFCI